MKIVLEKWGLGPEGQWELQDSQDLAEIRSSTHVLNVGGVNITKAGEGVRVWILGGAQIVFYPQSGVVKLEAGEVS
jgi:hypothetical protein